LEERMKRLFAYLTLVGFAVAPAFATDYTEEEPNDGFPPTFLTGDPVFLSGDRFVGTVDLGGDIDSHYLTFDGAGSAGLWRYTFDIDADGDTVMDLFDTTPDGFFLAVNDDFPGLDLSSRLIFDHFDTSGDDVVFGLDVLGFDETENFDYAVSWTRTAITPTDLGSLPGGTTTEDFVSTAGAGTWYTFTLDVDSSITIDTLASSTDFDSELALYDSEGNTIGGNDDSGDDFLSSISTDLAAGTYYLASGSFNARYDWDNANGGNLGWDRSGFSGGLDENPFTLTFNVTPVPEPTTMAVLGLGALALLRRRRKV
jgi:hypothetical protein